MNTSKTALWWHNIWRSETKNNIALCIVCIVTVVILWTLITISYGFSWSSTFRSLMKVGPTPAGVPVSVHFVLGLIGSVVITPFVFATITVWIRHRAQKVQLGQKRYKWIKNHIVMIGYNSYSASIILNLLTKPDNATTPLIILSAQPPKFLRGEMRTILPPSLQERIIIYAGSPQAEEHIRQLNLHLAKAVYVTLDGKEWSSAYSRAVSTLPKIAKCAGERAQLLPVNLLLNDDRAYEVAQTLNIPDEFKQCNGRQNLDVHMYSFYENWARLLWSYNGLKKENGDFLYDSLDFEPLENTDKYVHLVVVGFGDMGKALVNEAVRLCHYVNFDEATGRGKTRITVIDPKADAYKRTYMAAYPYLLQQATDIDLRFVNAYIEDAEMRTQLAQWATDEQQLLTVAICLKDPDLAMQTALTLPEEVYFTYRQDTIIHRSRILVRQAVRSGMKEIMQANNTHFANLKAFGSYYHGTDIEILNDDMEICVNGLYSERYYDNIDQIDCIEQMDVLAKYKDWQQLWFQTSEMNRQKTRYQIDIYRSIFAFLQRQGYAMGHILTEKKLVEQLARVEHRRWVALISLLGYRQAKPDEKRIEQVKIHNCIVPYDQLTRVEQLKDHVVIITAPILSGWEKLIQKKI